MSSNENMEGYLNLRNAIIIQAMRDYRIAKFHLKIAPGNQAALAVVKDVLSFLHSDWYAALCDIDCEYLIANANKHF